MISGIAFSKPLLYSNDFRNSILKTVAIVLNASLKFFYSPVHLMHSFPKFD
jgi:hypothetical protein